MKGTDLGTYNEKRNFTKTAEPRGQKVKHAAGPLRFVVQKHAASRLHFDFRLEAGRALKSWAVPKGPSYNGRDKRLAMMVEDHPLEYANFEGSIPEGEYGAGEVIVWDRGTYLPIVHDEPAAAMKAAEAAVQRGIAAGKLAFELHGQRLRGRWALVKLRDKETDWLLIKERDELTVETGGDHLARENSSVISKRVLKTAEQEASGSNGRHGTARDRRSGNGTTAKPSAGAQGKSVELKIPTKAEIAALSKTLAALEKEGEIEVGGYRVKITNPLKPLWPEADGRLAVTKRDLLGYLAAVSPYLLPQLKGRPLTVMRFPNGIGAQRIIQRHWEHEPPPFVQTARVFSDYAGGDEEYLLCENLPTLLWLGQLGCLEFHPWFSRIDPEPDGAGLTADFTGSEKTVDKSILNYPDYLVIDLDPYIYKGDEAKGAEPDYNKKAFAKVGEIALELRDLLSKMGLEPFVKTSGRTGLHIFVPILRQYDFDAVREACGLIGRHLMKSRPDDVTMEWDTGKRRGKVFFDHNMNSRSKSVAGAYSPRSNEFASVSAPLSWEEVGKIDPTEITIRTMPERIERVGDLWARLPEAKRKLIPATD